MKNEALRAAIQAEVGEDLLTAYVLIAKTALAADAESTGMLRLYDGSLDEQIGLLRYATIRTEARVNDEVGE